MDVTEFVNRSVQFAFKGHRFTFALSLGLFSSGGIDVGTRLLLKTLAPVVDNDVGRILRVLDVGSGVGVLGVSLAAALPKAQVEMIDRDALALEFSEHNARSNGARNCAVYGGLGLARFGGSVKGAGAFNAEGETVEEGYDLIVSNVPAKAGTPVLKLFCPSTIDRLNPDGRAAYVVVNPISDFIAESIRNAGGAIITTESGHDHTVFHFSRGSDESGGATDTATHTPESGGGMLDEAYVRRTGPIELESHHLELTTVYGIPEFDTPSYATVLAASMMHSGKIVAAGKGERALFWNPGQGHLPMYYLRGNAGRIGRAAMDSLRRGDIVLAGRDLLSLAISAKNVSSAGHVEPRIEHLASILSVADTDQAASYSEIFVRFENIPGAPIVENVVKAAKTLLVAGGILVISGSSHEMHRVISGAKGMTMVDSRKHRGYRALRLRKR